MTRDCNETFQKMLSNKNIAIEYEILIGNSGDLFCIGVFLKI